MTKGYIISLEGPDGAGKTTVLEKLIPLLETYYDREIVMTREPGGVAIAEHIRKIILDVENIQMDNKTELLLYMAARRQHYVEKVLPAISSGKLVLIDRFVDSSIAYQGFGRGLDRSVIDDLNKFATDCKQTDLTLLFDIDSEEGLARISKSTNREVNRLDLEQLDMHKRVRQGYLELAKQEPNRIATIDASQHIDLVVEQSMTLIKERLSIID